METLNLLSTTLLVLAVTVPEICSDGIETKDKGSLKPPPLVVNPIEELTSRHNIDKTTSELSLVRDKRQSNKQPENSKASDTETQKPPPDFNPLENLILNQDKHGFEPGASLSRVKRQYRRYPYPYPYPIPIFIGGGFGGGFGGRGFGGPGFGGRGFGGRGFGGRGFGGRGFGGRGFGGGFGGRGVGGGFGGGRGGGGRG